MSPKIQGLRGERRGNGSGRRFGELSDLVGVLLDQVHANLILHHTAQESTIQAHFAFIDPCCVGAATNPRFEHAMFGHAQVVHTNATQDTALC